MESTRRGRVDEPRSPAPIPSCRALLAELRLRAVEAAWSGRAARTRELVESPLGEEGGGRAAPAQARSSR